MVRKINVWIWSLLGWSLLLTTGAFGLGDHNGDGATDILDVLTSVNAAIGKAQVAPFHDVDADGRVSVLDVQLVVNESLGLRDVPEVTPALLPGAGQVSVPDGRGYVYFIGGVLTQTSTIAQIGVVKEGASWRVLPPLPLGVWGGGGCALADGRIVVEAWGEAYLLVYRPPMGLPGDLGSWHQVPTDRVFTGPMSTTGKPNEVAIVHRMTAVHVNVITGQTVNKRPFPGNHQLLPFWQGAAVQQGGARFIYTIDGESLVRTEVETLDSSLVPLTIPGFSPHGTRLVGTDTGKALLIWAGTAGGSVIYDITQGTFVFDRFTSMRATSWMRAYSVGDNVYFGAGMVKVQGGAYSYPSGIWAR